MNPGADVLLAKVKELTERVKAHIETKQLKPEPPKPRLKLIK